MIIDPQKPRPVEKAGPDFSVLPAVRAQIEQAEEKLQIACKELLKGGLTETHPHLLSLLRQCRVWTQKDGWLDWLEKDPIDHE